MDNYIPKPIDLSEVELSQELCELREIMAENTHEIWAAKRQAEGWTYARPMRLLSTTSAAL